MLKWIFVKKYKEKAVAYLERNFVENTSPQPKFSREIDIDYIMDKSLTRVTFVQKLEEHIKSKGLLSAEVYRPARIDRRLFSKIICNREYQPSKDTAIAFALALRLSLSDAEDLLERAGYALSSSIRRDVIIEYFINESIYNIDKINAVLYSMNEKPIGRSA